MQHLRRLLAALCLTVAGISVTGAGAAVPAVAGCAAPGWDPEYGLKDHAVFIHDHAYYLVSIRIVSESDWERSFAYARSLDLCHWEDLGPILAERRPGAWDERAVWAPFVIEEGGVYYMFYTGVTRDMTQSIMLATSTDPTNPRLWKEEGVVFQPNHPGMVWPGRGFWSDARDPMVIKDGSRYYLYYTGLDRDGGIVGLATATSLRGPWFDLGSSLTVPGAIIESSGVVRHGDYYYMFYHSTGDGRGPEMRVSLSPRGPWLGPWALRPGWAQEIWRGLDGSWYMSYLYGVGRYAVGIVPVVWPTPGERYTLPDVADPHNRVALPIVRLGR